MTILVLYVFGNDLEMLHFFLPSCVDTQRSGTVFACENWCIKGIMHLRLFLAAAGWFASCFQQRTCIAPKLSSATGTPMYFLFAILFCRSSSWASVFFIHPQKPKQSFSASSLSLFFISTSSVFPFGISVFQQFPWLAKQACWNSCSSCTVHSFQNSWQVLFKSMSALHSTPHFSGLFCIAVSRPSLVSWSLLPWLCNHLPKHSSRSCRGACWVTADQTSIHIHIHHQFFPTEVQLG